jgi:hypothetical protein
MWERRSKAASMSSSLAEERMRGMEKRRSMQIRALTAEMRAPSESESRMFGQGPWEKSWSGRGQEREE